MLIIAHQIGTINGNNIKGGSQKTPSTFVPVYNFYDPIL
nr:MAG TPA: hypothetical protein [Caudoviricetes sp.]